MADATTTTGALSHIRVLDLSRVLAGPLAGQILADLGAEVIKVERLGQGDDTRAWGPPNLRDDQGRDTGESAYFAGANRNKRSVAIDLAHPEGQALVRELARDCDVVIENFKVDGLKQYGLDHASLSALNPRLVYCSITGFGQDGPYAQRAGYDFLMQGLGGLMSITGHGGDQPGAGPMKVGVALTDVMTGLYAVIGVLAALAARASTQAGQHIDVALLDVQVAGLANQAMNFLSTGKLPERMGNAHPSIVPYQDFATADGFMIIAVGNDGQFARLAGALGQPGWASDARFASNSARVLHRAALVALIHAATVRQPTAFWIALLEQAGVPCGPINNVAQVFDDPQVRARGMRVELPHRLAGSVAMVANPLRLSATPVRYRHAAPLLGEHTRAVLQERLGLSAAQIALLEAAGAIACPDYPG